MIITSLKEQLDKEINKVLVTNINKSFKHEIEQTIDKLSKSIVLDFISDKKQYILSIDVSTRAIINQWEKEVDVKEVAKKTFDNFLKNVPQYLTINLDGVFVHEGFVGKYEYMSESVQQFMNSLLLLLSSTSKMSEEDIVTCQSQILEVLGTKYVILDVSEIQEIHPESFILKDKNGRIFATNLQEFKDFLDSQN